jgi:dihydropteroate synthase
MEKRYHWKLKQRVFILGERTLIMGILNVTPDSFSDGGKYDDPDRAFAHAIELEEQGADIIDVGAESTKPGATRIPEAEELRRLVPVLKRLKGRLSIPVSVDTYKSGVAEKAIEHGAEIINDPTGLLLDPLVARVATNHDTGLIINHMRGSPDTWAKLPPLKNLMRSIAIDIEAALHRAKQGGVQRRQIVIDPGIGFGKRKEQNAEIIANLRLLHEFDLPVMIGVSRKSFLKKDSDKGTEFATAAAVASSILNGAHIVRVHDVVAMKSVVEVADAIRNSLAEPEEPAPPPAPKPQQARSAGSEGRGGFPVGR